MERITAVQLHIGIAANCAQAAFVAPGARRSSQSRPTSSHPTRSTTSMLMRNPVLYILLALGGPTLDVANARDDIRPTTTTPAAPALPAAKKKPLPPQVLRVGPGRDFIFPSVAAQFAHDGDTIEIEAGDYEDVAVWKQSNITIRGVGGRPHVRAAGSSAEGKAVWVIKGKNVIVENVEISGAAVRDKNGAAIRAEGAGLILRKVYFHDNEQGLLTSHNKDSEVLIEESEFSRNGSGDGKTHNIYAGKIKSLTIRRSYIHHARIGHQIKSRAQRTWVLYNRIMDEDQGASS